MDAREEWLNDDLKNLTEQDAELQEAIITLSDNKTAADFLLRALEQITQARFEILYKLRQLKEINSNGKT